jgi:anti-sigma regulatory factor (Ser/Thr protein kinase)
MNQRWARYAVFAGAAVFMGSVLTLELYFNGRAEMQNWDLFDMAIPQFGRAAMWAVLVPLILRMREKMPLQRGHWVGGVAFHFFASFVVMATYYLGRMWSYSIFFTKFEEDGFWLTAWKSFYGRNIIDMAYYWGVIAFGYSFEIYRKYKSEELKAAQLETRLIETELKALRQQMHPHFLFNTMNTIAVLVREGRNDDAVTLLARLSSLLRMSLDNTGVPEVTLQQELDFLGHYIEIQKARFSDRLNVRLAIAPEALRARIPNLVLQPIVENAILHGIAPKMEPGHVDIRAEVDGDSLRLEVRDDGAGIAHGRAPAREGIGLANTRERLAKLYGARSRLTLQSEAGRGVSVEIVLPFRT